MKNSKNLFAAVIAITTLGLTLAAHAGALEAKKSLVPNCYTKILVTQPNPDVVLERGAFSCEAIIQYGNQTATQQTDASFPVINSDQCVAIPAFFCCATIVSGRINQIFCKSTPGNNFF